MARSPVRHAPASSPAEALGVSARVIRADAFDALGALGAASVDLLITSPPYWGLRDYGFASNDALLDDWHRLTNRPERPPGYTWYRAHGGVLGLEPYPEWYVSHLVEFFARSRPLLKPGASIWVNLGDTYFARWSSIRRDGRQGMGSPGRQRRRTPSGGWRHDKQLLMLPARFAIAMQEAGWILRNDLIWSKRNLGPRPEADRLKLSHEHFFHFVQRTPGGRPRYYYDLDGVEDGALDVVCATRGDTLPGHSATFPRSLVTPRVLSCSPPGGMVLDPFCGSATALAVAMASKRNATGIELSTRFADAAVTRLQSEFDCCADLRPVELSVLQRAV
jgi:site-specific DNA-methyltransferase (cytosine-N4-specific)